MNPTFYTSLCPPIGDNRSWEEECKGWKEGRKVGITVGRYNSWSVYQLEGIQFGRYNSWSVYQLEGITVGRYPKLNRVAGSIAHVFNVVPQKRG